MTLGFYLTNNGWAVIYACAVITCAFIVAALALHVFADMRQAEGRVNDARIHRDTLAGFAYAMLVVTAVLFGVLGLTQQPPA